MHVVPSHYTVVDYCKAMIREDIIVNRTYQRSRKVWPEAARSFLIETVLLNYRMPKFYLYEKVDLRTRKAHREIVDGQQRSQAILDFYNGNLRLSRSSDIPEFAGKVYSELDDEDKHCFLAYDISADVFVSATDEDIRETFRRINSYMAPLNAEEKRHCMYQGELKWFAYRLSKSYARNLADIGVFRESQLARMADVKLYSEIIHAIRNGITLTVARDLNRLYSDLDRNFPEAEQNEIEQNFRKTMNFLLRLEEIHEGPLMKPYNFYSLFLAAWHVRNPIHVIEETRVKKGTDFMSIYKPPMPYSFNQNTVVSNLIDLAEAFEEGEDHTGGFKEFVKATLSKTNSRENRATRFKWFCRALQPGRL